MAFILLPVFLNPYFGALFFAFNFFIKSGMVACSFCPGQACVDLFHRTGNC